MLALQRGGAITFENAGAIQQSIIGVQRTAGQDIIAAIVTDAAGNLMFNSDLDAAGGALGQAITLAGRATADGQVAFDEAGKTFAVLAFFGSGNAVAVVVVTQWTNAHRIEAMRAGRPAVSNAQTARCKMG